MDPTVTEWMSREQTAKEHLIQSLTQARRCRIRAVSNQLLILSRAEISKTSLINLWLSLVILTIKKWVLLFRRSVLSFSLCPLPLDPSLGKQITWLLANISFWLLDAVYENGQNLLRLFFPLYLIPIPVASRELLKKKVNSVAVFSNCNYLICEKWENVGCAWISYHLCEVMQWSFRRIMKKLNF